MRQIEILRASYALQLLILSTGAHFQRVSEHYMVTRTFLSILTLERERSGTKSVPYNSMDGVVLTQGFICAFGEGYTMVALLPTGLG